MMKSILNLHVPSLGIFHFPFLCMLNRKSVCMESEIKTRKA